MTHAKTPDEKNARTGAIKPGGSGPQSRPGGTGQGSSHVAGSTGQTRQQDSTSGAHRQSDGAGQDREQQVSGDGPQPVPSQQRTTQHAGQSDPGLQPGHPSVFKRPQGDGNYQATDTGQLPLKNQE